MTDLIYTHLSTLNLKIDTKIIKRFEDLVVGFELRGQNPIALNSQTIGVRPIAFLPSDRAAFFEIFNLTETTVKHLIEKISVIHSDRKVTSDPFNVLSVWVMHLAYRDIPSIKTRNDFLMNVTKYLHYRFFTSLINRYFPHGTDEKVMVATINGLSRKFDIVVYGTWKKTIEARCEDFISEDSLHVSGLKRADNDNDFLYVISDLQSRIRDKVKNIAEAYYGAHKTGDKITSKAATSSDRDGEKILVHTTRTLDLMIYNLQNEILIERMFIDNATVSMIAKQFTNISEDMLKSALKSIVDLAKTQSDSKQLDAVKIIDGQSVYIGLRIFITNLIQKTYRYCIQNGVDVTNQAQMFVKIKNIYSSSRISDVDILANKQSMVYLVSCLNVFISK